MSISRFSSTDKLYAEIKRGIEATDRLYEEVRREASAGHHRDELRAAVARAGVAENGLSAAVASAKAAEAKLKKLEEKLKRIDDNLRPLVTEPGFGPVTGTARADTVGLSVIVAKRLADRNLALKTISTAIDISMKGGESVLFSCKTESRSGKPMTLKEFAECSSFVYKNKAFSIKPVLLRKENGTVTSVEFGNIWGEEPEFYGSVSNGCVFHP